MKAFARKELRRNTTEGEFRYEEHNLNLVKKLQDDHLIKLVKSYRHGDNYNFIFPRARTNLNSILRDEDPESRLNFEGPLYLHPLWNQMLGVAKGLHKVLDYEVADTKPENSMYGYHLDLKPDNILVYGANHLVITDFGQANFKNADGTTSRVNGMGGNEMYAPPEIDLDNVVNTRKYDIWSLGCILLEVCTFVANGVRGVKHLDRIRSEADPETRNSNDCFFRPVPTSGLDLLAVGHHRSRDYELKPRIREWIEQLPQYAYDVASKEFLREILSVVLEMLDTNLASRISSKEVCIQLSEIISHYHGRDHDDQRISYTRPERPSEGFIIGVELLENIQAISYNLEGFWMCAPLYFIQKSALLCVQVFEGREWKTYPLGSWSLIKLVPQYALENQGKQSTADATILVSLNDPSRPPGRKYGKFSTFNVLLLQELLLAQKVQKQIELETVAMELKVEKKASRFISRRKSNNSEASSEVDERVNANCLQIWTESPRTDMIRLSREERRQSPRSLRLRPNIVRIVVFYQKSILILRLTQDMQIGKKDNGDPASTLIDIVPRGKASFPISILRPDPNDLFAGFSLSEDDFEAKEMECRKDCKKLELNFQSNAGADSFQRAYKRLKKQWLNELEKFDRLQGDIGAEIGYCQRP